MVRLHFTSLGLNASIEVNNGDMIYIEAKENEQKRLYASYSRNKNSTAFKKSRDGFLCKLENPVTSSANSIVKSITNRLIGTNSVNFSVFNGNQATNNKTKILARISERPMRTYKLAVASTAEYTQRFGSNNNPSQTSIQRKNRTLAHIVTIINQVRRIYRKDLSVDLRLVSGTRAIYDVAPDKDPYTNRDIETMLDENETNLNDLFGLREYDLGHVLGSTSGNSNGLAMLSSVCHYRFKAQGATIIGNDGLSLTRFTVEYVAHEIGHQLGGNHTFNSASCIAGSRSWHNAVEPGTGVTIMSYGGGDVCDSREDLQIEDTPDNIYKLGGNPVPILPIFHGHSIVQIHNYTHRWGGKWCGTENNTGNRSPIVTLGRSIYTIPAGTPFILSPRTVTDPDNNGMNYSWEQVDSGSPSKKNKDLTNNAIIRSKPPVFIRDRTIPQLSDLVLRRKTDGEVLPKSSRVMKFRLTARDFRGGVNSEDQRVKVFNTGSPFQVTAPNGSGLLGSSVSNKSYIVRWDVAKTDKTPIFCSRVDIAATDKNGKVVGTLATNVGNNGIRSVYIPSWLLVRATNQMRIRVKCSNNIFFGLSGLEPSTHIAD